VEAEHNEKGTAMRPTAKEAYTRLLALRYVVAYSIFVPKRPEVKGIFARWSREVREYNRMCGMVTSATLMAIDDENLWDSVSPKEMRFITGFSYGMGDYVRFAASWRSECMIMLMWALGLYDRWPPIDKETAPEIAGALPRGKAAFEKMPELLPAEEIDKKRDLIELWHWRQRTRQLVEMGEVFPATEKSKAAGLGTFDDVVRLTARESFKDGQLPEIKDEDFVFLGKPFRDLTDEEYSLATSIIMERHHALNWLCGYAPENFWDLTPTET